MPIQYDLYAVEYIFFMYSVGVWTCHINIPHLAEAEVEWEATCYHSASNVCKHYLVHIRTVCHPIHMYCVCTCFCLQLTNCLSKLTT